ncbi:MAG: D-2-hydroxyacid dehydrogenase [Candidatus Dormibacteria bacterium]
MPVDRLVVFTTPLEPELVERLRQTHPEYTFEYPEELIATPRYPGHHRMPDAQGEQLERWRALLSRAEVMFDFGPPPLHTELAHLPKLRWIQATSAGVGQFVRRVGLDRTAKVVVTTARGVHGRALAEFAIFAMIYFNRDLPEILADQRLHQWARRSGRLVAGQEVVIVGLGSIGREVATLARALGARTTGVVRSLEGRTAASSGVDRLLEVGELESALPEADFLVLAMPHTDETEGLISGARLSLLPQSAVVVNLARGTVVDEEALTSALRDGRLRGAALDVFREEPLPPGSPLWDLANVLVTPHSMSTVDGENQLLAQLFSENLERYRHGAELLNVLRKDRLY